MVEQQGLLSGGWDRVTRNKRYIVWFYVLNLVLAWLGAAAFSNQLHDYLDHSLLSQRLVHGFDVGVLVEMFVQPEFGTTHAARVSGLHFALIFFFATALFLPGVLQGYASTYHLPREDFFRACGRNLWRFIRLLIVAGIVMGVVAGALFGLHSVVEKKALESTHELLLFEVRVVDMIIIFLVMTALRVWFDLAETDVVLSDQRAVRRSIGTGFRHTWRDLGRPGRKLCSDDDCGGDRARGRALGVDEVGSAGQCARSIFSQSVHTAPVADSTLLAARSGGHLLPAEYGRAGCDPADHACASCAGGERANSCARYSSSAAGAARGVAVLNDCP